MSSFSLSLNSEWGGETFGPFSSEIMVGSDPQRCQVLLRDDLPLEGEHVRVIPTRIVGELWLHPMPGALVYIWRQNRPWELSEPCVIHHGESFSLMTTSGPCLRVQVQTGTSGRHALSGSTAPQSDHRILVGLALAAVAIVGCVLFFALLNRGGERQTPEPEEIRGSTSTKSMDTGDDADIYLFDSLPEGYHRNANRTPRDFPDRMAPMVGSNNWRSGRISGFQQLEMLRDERDIQVVINLARDSYEHQSDRARSCGGIDAPCEPTWARELGLEYYEFHMGARGPSDKKWAQIQDLLAEGNVLVHCAYGVDRTGAVSGRWARCFDESRALEDSEVLDYTISFGGQWLLKDDPNAKLRSWMLFGDPCGPGGR